MELSIDTLRELTSKGDETDGFTVVDVSEKGSSRWANVYVAVFREDATGKFYSHKFRSGTGDEGERPYENFDGDERQECVEMEEYEVTVKKYRVKP